MCSFVVGCVFCNTYSYDHDDMVVYGTIGTAGTPSSHTTTTYDAYGFICVSDMECVLVSFTVNSNSADSQSLGGAHDAQGNFTTVGHKDLVKEGLPGGGAG